jgi:hypothetical protein
MGLEPVTLGLEPTMSSLGSVATRTGALRNAPRINTVRPACFSMRQRFGAASSINGPQGAPMSRAFTVVGIHRGASRSARLRPRVARVM